MYIQTSDHKSYAVERLGENLTHVRCAKLSSLFIWR